MNILCVLGRPEAPYANSQKASLSAESLTTISNVVLSAFIILMLYFGRGLLVALATLLTFMLAPLCTRLQRLIGRIGAVLLVVVMMFAATGGVGWVLTRQAIDLADPLPGYKDNIQDKLRSIQLPSEGPLSRLTETIEDLKKDLPGISPDGEESLSYPAGQTRTKVMQVEVVDGKNQGIEFMVGLWRRTGLTSENLVALRESGADKIVTSLAEAVECLKPGA